MKEILNIKDKIFEKECLDILNKIEKTEKTTLSNENVYDKIVNYFAIHYKYIVGTLLAYYALNYCKFEDIVKLNEKINSDEYKNMSIQEILETIGINLNDNFISKAIQCIKNNIYEKKVIK